MAGFFTGKDLPAIAGKDEPVMVNAGNVPGNILPGFAGNTLPAVSPVKWPAIYCHQLATAAAAFYGAAVSMHGTLAIWQYITVTGHPASCSRAMHVVANQ